MSSYHRNDISRISVILILLTLHNNFSNSNKTNHKYSKRTVRFEVLKAASMKMTVSWEVALCSLVEVYRRFRGACRLHHHGLIMVSANTSETSVNFYQTTWPNIPEDSHLYNYSVGHYPPSKNTFKRQNNYT
jgi:hypothetical protein